MGTSSEVSLAHHRDIFHYYVSLKTFSRWLAKIVTGQIRHELKRPEPSCWSYLLRNFTSWVQTCPMSCRGESVKMLTNQITFLPKANFHMKRNQARQKLANLSQTRFNDLLDDILFEIKRRGFDKDLMPHGPHYRSRWNKRSAKTAMILQERPQILPLWLK